MALIPAAHEASADVMLVTSHAVWTHLDALSHRALGGAGVPRPTDGRHALVLRGGRTLKDHPPVPGVSVDAVRWTRRRGVSLYTGDIEDARPPA